MLTTNILGKKYEAIAINYLKSKKYKIIEKNYSNKAGEIDIICKDTKENYIVFIEVKYRTSDKIGTPLEAIDLKKQNKIKITASCFLKQYNLLDCNFRFDAIAISNDEITHIENAF